MAVKSNLDLDSDARTIIGVREFDMPREPVFSRTRITWRSDFPSAAERKRVVTDYHADSGRVETMERLAEYVAA